MQNMMQERALADSGQLRQSSNVGGGQMVAADFVLTPNVVFSEGNAGGVGGAVGGLFRRASPVVGAVAGGLKFRRRRRACCWPTRAAAYRWAPLKGSTRKADLRLGGLLFGGGVGAAAGGYGNTNEGKIIAAAFMDNYNNIVGVVRGDASLQRNVGTLKDEAAAGGKTKTGAVFSEGDVLVPKIANVKLLATPADDGKPLATLARTDEVVVIGEEKNGYINVQGASASGWVKIVLMLRP